MVGSQLSSDVSGRSCGGVAPSSTISLFDCSTAGVGDVVAPSSTLSFLDVCGVSVLFAATDMKHTTSKTVQTVVLDVLGILLMYVTGLRKIFTRFHEKLDIVKLVVYIVLWVV